MLQRLLIIRLVLLVLELLILKVRPSQAAQYQNLTSAMRLTCSTSNRPPYQKRVRILLSKLL
jgi:predicted DNA-binding ribbon-helix-helix protein